MREDCCTRHAATRMQPLEPDATDLRARYHELFAARIADWWAAHAGDGRSPGEAGS